MSLPYPQLLIDDLLVPLQANVKLTQTYEPLEGATLRRCWSGRAVKQTHWRKLKTTISANGWVALSLLGLDWDATHELACIAPRSIDSTANAITLPAARRSDVAPWGFALMPDGLLRQTSVDVDEDVATLAAVDGASQYRVQYLPLLVVYMKPPSESLDARGAAYQWQLECEEA